MGRNATMRAQRTPGTFRIGAKTQGRLESPTAQHPGCGQRLGQATRIPRNSARKAADRPTDIRCDLDVFGCRIQGSFRSRSAQPRSDSPKRKKGHPETHQSQRNQRLPKQQASRFGESPVSIQFIPHAEDLPVLSPRGTFVRPLCKSRVKRNTPSRDNQRDQKN
jgi:hypothetical protein